jgi:hypothetical protein
VTARKRCPLALSHRTICSTEPGEGPRRVRRDEAGDALASLQPRQVADAINVVQVEFHRLRSRRDFKDLNVSEPSLHRSHTIACGTESDQCVV